ncbi:MAG: tRNA pseudouridine(13) synthase TruD [Planctomycetes bacterium]|nr:tRNA pseudouridine(13) synthase TruD [Planctomycetota bacterium]
MSSAAELRLATADLPGIGGRFKASPEDFEVTELPLYEAGGEGEHLYLRIRRRGRNTRDVVRVLARLAGLRDREVGYAGLKDRQAVATQSFSLAIRPADEADFLSRLAERDDLELLEARRHRNKLGRGHLVGNRFRIRIREVAADAEARARAVLDRLALQGLPNYFGPQRYGNDGLNAERGAAIVAGERERDRFLRELYLHAWQSRLFDAWLAERLRRGDWCRLVEGDVARLEERGGLFLVEDLAAELPRAERGEISATGPMFGAKMMSTTAEAAAIERALAPPEALDLARLRELRLVGARRVARIFPREIELVVEEGALLVAFVLAKGSYATSVLRELMKEGAAMDALQEGGDD